MIILHSIRKMRASTTSPNYDYRLDGARNKSNTTQNHTMLILFYQHINLINFEALSLALFNCNN